MSDFDQNVISHKAAELGLLDVGAHLESRARTVTETDVTMFSALTGDWHPQHSDVEWAKRSLFGERVAHGLLVLSLAVGLVEFDREQVIALRRLRNVVFKRPVRLGDTIRVRARVESVRPILAESVLLGLRWRVVNAREETALRAEIEVLCRSSPVGEGPLTADDDELFAPNVYPF
jgi:3-hydroxybutyryl-CoA dehydratase